MVCWLCHRLCITVLALLLPQGNHDNTESRGIIIYWLQFNWIAMRRERGRANKSGKTFSLRFRVLLDLWLWSWIIFSGDLQIGMGIFSIGRRALVTICWYLNINALFEEPSSPSPPPIDRGWWTAGASPSRIYLCTAIIGTMWRFEGILVGEGEKNNNNVIDGNKLLFITSPVITFKLIGKIELLGGDGDGFSSL